ncbi:MAG: IS4 family transposase [Candidatus Kapabacteria bacterium]|nr:IS4 family transposase [Candidatus Kapabacteria bacterium]
MSYQESLRSIAICLNSQKEKIYHLGFSSSVVRTTLADANEKRSWKIYRDFARVLINEAKEIYCDDKSFDLELDGACYAIDSTVIELCLNIFGWAKLKKVRSAIKLHMGIDLKGNLPAFFDISNAKLVDTNFLDLINYEAGAYYIFDRGYLSFERFFNIQKTGAFFVTRAKIDFGFERLYSNLVDKETNVRCDQVVKLTNKLSNKRYPAKLRQVKYYDQENKRTFVFFNQQL